MSCRSTPANSAFTTCARLSVSSLVPASAVLSKFHELKEYWDGYPDKARYIALIDREIAFVATLEEKTISDANRVTLLAKLNQAKDSRIPDGATFIALRGIREEAKRTEAGVKRFCKDMSVLMEMSLKDMKAHFIELTALAPRSSSNVTKTYTADQQYMARAYDFSRDKGLMFAMIRINAEYEATLKKKIKDTPHRISQIEITDLNAQKTGIKNLLLTHLGYDHRNERLEVTIANQLTGKSKIYAYRSCHLFRNIAECPDIGKIWSERIRGASWRSYDTKLLSALAGMAPKCTNCGQFASVDHGCPMGVEPYIILKGLGSGWTNEIVGNSRIPLPRITLLNNALMVGAVTIKEIGYKQRDGQPIHGGSVTIYQDETNKIKINSSQLACPCSTYQESEKCQHVELILKAIKQRIAPVSLLLSGVTTAKHKQLVKKAQARILVEEQITINKVRTTDWTLIPKELREAKKKWREEATVLYSRDFVAFETDYKKAMAQSKNHKVPVIPYLRENALDGMATRASGQGFGVELEYEFKSELSWKQREEANKKIGLALFNAKLTPSRDQQDYHSAQENGYTDVHIDSKGKGTWSFEDDGSVDGGEIVSPIMYDEKVTWDNLEKVIKILRDNGAVPTENAGSHVHVGTGFYGSSPAKYAELVQLMNQHEDVLYRLASDPSRGSHRGTEYAIPNQPINPIGFKKIANVRKQTESHSALNLRSISGIKKDHAEFRLFDATLDPGTIQSQIKLAVAMTHAAVRVNPRKVTSRPKEELGIHLKKRAIFKAMNKKETLEEETTTLRSLLDTLFSRREDKAQVVSIFANTKWNKNDSNQ